MRIWALLYVYFVGIFLHNYNFNESVLECAQNREKRERMHCIQQDNIVSFQELGQDFRSFTIVFDLYIWDISMHTRYVQGACHFVLSRSRSDADDLLYFSGP